MKTFYVSSYGKSDNKGIYIIDLNEENQKLSLVQHIVTHILNIHLCRDIYF